LLSLWRIPPKARSLVERREHPGRGYRTVGIVIRGDRGALTCAFTVEGRSDRPDVEHFPNDRTRLRQRSRGGQQLDDPFGGVDVDLLTDVLVQIHRDSDVRMAEGVRHDLDVDPSLEHERRRGVPPVVESDHR
jgi:hypothetical protein